MSGRRATPGSLLIALPAIVAGCTFEPGEYFAEIRPQLSAAYVAREDRVVEARWQKLASGYQVRLGRASLQLDRLQLLSTASGNGSGTTFDPAMPPPGYSLCHNGHCHSDDGRLVSYEEIAAAQGAAGGGQGPRPVLTFAGGDPFDLLVEEPAFRALPCPSATSCGVGRTRVSQLRLDLRALQVEGEVRDGEGPPLPGGQASFLVDLTSAPGKPLLTLQTALDLAADNRHPPRVELDVAVALGAELFDGLAWAELAGPAGTVISLATDTPGATAARATLLENLVRAEVGGQIRRSNP